MAEEQGEAELGMQRIYKFIKRVKEGLKHHLNVLISARPCSILIVKRNVQAKEQKTSKHAIHKCNELAGSQILH